MPAQHDMHVDYISKVHVKLIIIKSKVRNMIRVLCLSLRYFNKMISYILFHNWKLSIGGSINLFQYTITEGEKIWKK